MTDYVFAKGYALPSLEQTIDFIQAEHCLPIPIAMTIQKDGIDLGRMNKLLLEGGEMTLHMIEMKRGNRGIEKEYKIDNNQHPNIQPFSTGERLYLINTFICMKKIFLIFALFVANLSDIYQMPTDRIIPIGTGKAKPNRIGKQKCLMDLG